MEDRIRTIREQEKASHTRQYTDEAQAAWLQKPIKTVRELLPYFEGRRTLRVLDLGCGVGRNALAIAEAGKDADCTVDCVDILDIAIETLNRNAEALGLRNQIHGIVQSIEDFSILPKSYDFILAVSALEHIDTEAHFLNKLWEIKAGIRDSGIVCLILNSDVHECNAGTGESVPAQFEINLSTERMLKILESVFGDWEVLKKTTREQTYDIPREFGLSQLTTHVVTLTARRRSHV